jgi:Asp-tRNA(Asn)/Glu-tRNA(Gln) amidotransferase A subunit family amidase
LTARVRRDKLIGMLRLSSACVLALSLAACTADTAPGVDDIAAAEELVGVPMSAAERDLMLPDVRDQRAAYDTLHEWELPNDAPMALVFDPGYRPGNSTASPRFSRTPTVTRPDSDADLAYMSVVELGQLLGQGDLSSLELTRVYLDRIRMHDPRLLAFITVTEEIALEQARAADADFEAGVDRGPLQGIPYGLKDLAAVAGAPTTWGGMPYRDQVIDDTATVARRLEEAGAVLLGKTSVGALAWGDVWFGGQTKSPWNPEEGAQGSSAGSAAGVAAGLFPFAIGTETWGSIVSPTLRNGISGLRPTFGAVSRHGVMTLSWSMDKVGALCRYAEDCALVFDAIRGPDGLDSTVQEAGFAYDAALSLSDLRLGYLAADFELEYRGREHDLAVLDALRREGISLEATALPDLPIGAMSFILATEAATAFDALTRSEDDDRMVRQIRAAWPNVFRASRFVPAVEYLQANRLRMLLIDQMEEMMTPYDAVLAPCLGGDQLLATNLTGHPSMAVSTAVAEDGFPTGLCLIGAPFGEGALVTAAGAIQELTGFATERPPLFAR